MAKSKNEANESGAASAATPPAGATPAPEARYPVKVTDRGDGWVLPNGERLSGGQTVDVDKATARYLTDAGFAQWTTKIRALALAVVTARTVIGKGQTALVSPDEAERLVRLGVAEAVKEGE